MRTALLHSILFNIILCALFSSYAAADKSELATVRGIVSDTTGARIVGASVSFTGGGKHHVAVTAPDGTYEVKLKPGIYTVIASLRHFCPAHRGEISLSRAAIAQIDFELVVCGFVDPVQQVLTDAGNVSEQPTTTQSIGIYKEDKLSPIPPMGLRPYVFYAVRQQQDDSLLYSGRLSDKEQSDVVFTYNLTTVRAATVFYNPKRHSVEGVGNVAWQDGHQTWRGSKITLELNSEPPKVTLKQ